MQTPSLNIIFAGTPAFSAITLDALIHSPHSIKAVYTQPDRPKGRGQKLLASPVKELALRYDLPLYQPITLRDPKEQHILSKIHADIMIVVAYGLLLPLPVLQAPRLGCINIHASLLPRWRGAAPIQRAILAGDKKTGITIMQMEEGLDTGPMLYTVECAIEDHDTTEILHHRLAQLGADALLKTLDHLDTIKPELQNNANATYANKISKDEALLDWHASADELNCKIRAFNPWPVAQTHLGEQTIRIWQASVIDITPTQKPGEIMQSNAQGIDVSTGKKVLRILKLQLPGGRVLSVADMLNAHQKWFAPNQCFGKTHEP